MKRNIIITIIFVVLAMAFASCADPYLGIWEYYGDTDEQDRWIELTEDGTFNYVVMKSPNFNEVEWYYTGTYTADEDSITLKCTKKTDGSQSETVREYMVNYYEWTELDPVETLGLSYAKDKKNLKITFPDGVTISMSLTEEDVFDTTRALEAVRGF
ncbi:MAG: hypothetical protein JEY99_14655 [Spirochaetales bacterium]|nr:hypothetical protein [Spirochaetales bacterium]